MGGIESIFSQFKESDFAVVRYNQLGHPSKLRHIDVAQAIVTASEQGKRPVNFKLSSEEEYWNNFTQFGYGRIIDAALDHLGYGVSFLTNSTSDGRYYHLSKKPVPVTSESGTPSA